MFNFSLGIGYMIDKRQTIGLSYDYTKYDYIRGNGTYNKNSGVRTGVRDNSIDTKNSMINLSYNYIF